LAREAIVPEVRLGLIGTAEKLYKMAELEPGTHPQPDSL
jgi:hypothetical protein